MFLLAELVREVIIVPELGIIRLFTRDEIKEYEPGNDQQLHSVWVHKIFLLSPVSTYVMYC